MKPCQNYFVIFLHGTIAPSGPGRFIFGGFTIALLPPYSVGLLWTSDLENIQHSKETDIHAQSGIRAHSPSKRTAADPRLRPCCYWYRLIIETSQLKLTGNRPLFCFQGHKNCKNICREQYRIFLVLNTLMYKTNTMP